MAFRIPDSVVRGEIDNREKGIVRGRIWVESRTEPVALELKGNAWPDRGSAEGLVRDSRGHSSLDGAIPRTLGARVLAA